MRHGIFLSIALAVGVVNPAVGQTAAYTPLSSWTDPTSVARSRWESDLQERLTPAKPVRPEDRPRLAGLRPRSVELLEDGLMKKQKAKLRNDPRLARRAISDLYRSPRAGRNVLHGTMAEAIFLDRNPEWGYVRKQNAPQHDVYRWVNGRRTPLNGQIKFHKEVRPSVYAADMREDHLARRFFIPDDHVDPVKTYLKAEAMRLEAGGDPAAALKKWGDYRRIRPLGATSAEIRSAATEAARSLARERSATYTSLGATLALSFGSTAYDWASGDLSANVAAYRAMQAGSMLVAAAGADAALKRLAQGSLRGTLRGNAIVGATLLFVETAWSAHEHGWGQALSRPEFYEQFGGGVGSFSLGLAAGTLATGLAVETGPLALVIGGGVGLITGTVGYFGGRATTRAIIEILSPEMLRTEERQRVESVKSALDGGIARLQNFSQPR